MGNLVVKRVLPNHVMIWGIALLYQHSNTQTFKCIHGKSCTILGGWKETLQRSIPFQATQCTRNQDKKWDRAREGDSTTPSWVLFLYFHSLHLLKMGNKQIWINSRCIVWWGACGYKWNRNLFGSMGCWKMCFLNKKIHAVWNPNQIAFIFLVPLHSILSRHTLSETQ